MGKKQIDWMDLFNKIARRRYFFCIFLLRLRGIKSDLILTIFWEKVRIMMISEKSNLTMHRVKSVEYGVILLLLGFESKLIRRVRFPING